MVRVSEQHVAHDRKRSAWISLKSVFYPCESVAKSFAGLACGAIVP